MESKVTKALLVCGFLLIFLCMLNLIPLLPDKQNKDHKERCYNVMNNSKQIIPRHIHQIYFDMEGKDILNRYQFARKSWLNLCPGFRYTLWDKPMVDNLVRENFPSLYQLYSSQSEWISKTNIGRYIIIYKFGGIYADIDMECIQNVEPLLSKIYNQKDNFLLHRGDNFDRIAIDFFAATANHSLLAHALSSLPKASTYWYLLPYIKNMFTTGTPYFNNCYKSFQNKCQLFEISYKNEYVHHHRASSWHRWDGKIISTVWFQRGLLLKIVTFVFLVITFFVVFRRRKYRRMKVQVLLRLINLTERTNN